MSAKRLRVDVVSVPFTAFKPGPTADNEEFMEVGFQGELTRLKRLFQTSAERWPNLESHFYRWPDGQAELDVPMHIGLHFRVTRDGQGQESIHTGFSTFVDEPACRFFSGFRGKLVLVRTIGRMLSGKPLITTYEDAEAAQRFMTLSRSAAELVKANGLRCVPELRTDTLCWPSAKLWLFVVHKLADPPWQPVAAYDTDTSCRISGYEAQHIEDILVTSSRACAALADRLRAATSSAASERIDETKRPDPAYGGDDQTGVNNGGYPTPDNYYRDEWIYEQSKAGRTIPQIRSDLNERSEWYPLESDNGIRDAVKRYANYAGLPVPRKRPGKPRGQ